VLGRVRFSSAGQIDLPQTMIQVQKGAVVPIYAENGFIGKPLYPMPGWDKR
jgi:hypothetical protein